MVMKEQLIEQIEGLEGIISAARDNKANKIHYLFNEVFDFSNVEYSQLNVSPERAEFYFNNERWGSFTAHFYESFGDDETKLEVNTPSFSGDNGSRLTQWGKIAEQIFANGDEFLSKLKTIREEHKKGIEATYNMLGEARKKLEVINRKELEVDRELVKIALSTIGRTFESKRWVQVSAHSSINTNNIRIERTPGKKTYTIFYTAYYDRQESYSRVREMYINKLVNEIVNADRNNA
jgi:hypothetical protein